MAHVKVVEGQEGDMKKESWSPVTAGTGQLRCSARKRGAESKGGEKRRKPREEGCAGAEQTLSGNSGSCTGQGWRERKAEDRQPRGRYEKGPGSARKTSRASVMVMAGWQERHF